MPLKYIPLLILWLGLLSLLLLGQYKDFSFIFSLGITLLISLLIYFKIVFGEILLWVVLTAGVLGLMHFFPISLTVGFYFDRFTLGVDLLMLPVVLLHATLNREQLSGAIGWVRRAPDSEEKDERRRAAVLKFKHRYSKLNTKKLTEIASSNQMVPEAKSAAKEILNSRSTVP